jgi:hypothetical protein
VLLDREDRAVDDHELVGQMRGRDHRDDRTHLFVVHDGGVGGLALPVQLALTHRAVLHLLLMLQRLQVGVAATPTRTAPRSHGFRFSIVHLFLERTVWPQLYYTTIYRKRTVRRNGPGRQMEEYVWQKIMEAMNDPEVFITHYLSKEYVDPTKVERLQHTLNTLRERRVNIELAIGRVEAAYDHGTYSEEKMAAKIAQHNTDIADIDDKIQEIEDQLRLMGAVDVEVQKLREASEQVKYRMEKLDKRQQKILCNLFVDKVKMRRVREGKKWRIQAQVCFRFNPKKFAEPPKEGRTETGLVEAMNGSSEAKKSLIGGPGGT